MAVINLLAPLFLIIALGALLQRGGMLGVTVVEGINRLLYWVGLPAAVFHALVSSQSSGQGAGTLLVVMVVATSITAALAWWGGPLLGVKPHARGTFTQGAFKGPIRFELAFAVSTIVSTWVSLGQTTRT